MAKKTIHLISAKAFEVIFGISKRRIGALGIDPTIIDGEKCYSLDEVTARCQATVAKTMASRTDTGRTMGKESIKTAKLQEQARRLEMLNDETESGLVDHDEYSEDFAEKLAAVKAIISETPDAILEACPDIDPAALDIVSAEIEIAVRPQVLKL